MRWVRHGMTSMYASIRGEAKIADISADVMNVSIMVNMYQTGKWNFGSLIRLAKGQTLNAHFIRRKHK